MKRMVLNIYSKSGEIPTYAHATDSGMDLKAFSSTENSWTIHPNQVTIIPTGVFIALPPGYEAQIRSRSGLAAKYGVFVVNSPGTIDEGYRGELQVILTKVGNANFEEEYVVNTGDKIAQLVIAPVSKLGVVLMKNQHEFEKLPQTTRMAGGLGSTGR